MVTIDADDATTEVLLLSLILIYFHVVTCNYLCIMPVTVHVFCVSSTKYVYTTLLLP